MPVGKKTRKGKKGSGSVKFAIDFFREGGYS